MEPMTETAAVVLLWGLAGLLLGWTWLPALISGLGATRYSNGGSEDSTALTPDRSEPDYQFWLLRITALGYEPLGTAWMKINYHGPNWRYETQVQAFFSRTNQTYIFIQKQPKPLDVWWVVVFATSWNNGGLLLTSNGADEPPGDGDYIVQGMESDDLRAVEELHLAQRDRLLKEGRHTERDQSLETLLTAMRVHSGPAARYLGMKLGQSYLAAHGIIHIFVSLPVVYLSDFTHWSLPLVNLILGGLLALGDRGAKVRAGKMLRDQIARMTRRSAS